MTQAADNMSWTRRTVRRFRRDAHMLWIAAGDRRTPWVARALAWVTAAYVLSPIDFIPDFIPFFGLLDELLLVPLAVALFVLLVPRELMQIFRAEADAAASQPVSRAGAVMVMALWGLLAAVLAFQFWALRFW